MPKLDLMRSMVILHAWYRRNFYMDTRDFIKKNCESKNMRNSLAHIIHNM